ncbi:uncharacterized protein LOC103524415 [Diaphorina citri]|uniref:Uncharacterized protein LOC103524415 n=1 Tax=Diaphorina citri TaxID=121845 RepID=A0A3Q0JLR0_DIACI|nr:uncharacterized protein LOC103524415 [Diaphorina citri]
MYPGIFAAFSTMYPSAIRSLALGAGTALTVVTLLGTFFGVYDPRNQLTPRQINATIRTTYEQLVSNISDDRLQAVVLSLDIIKPDINDFGTKVFKTLFKEHPEYQDFVLMCLRATPFIKPLENKLDANKSFTHHVNAVVLAIANSVVNLKNPSAVLPELEKLGTSHQRRNIRPEQFEGCGNWSHLYVFGKP